ncbi:Transcription initiation factor TFIID subunit 3 [Orchesella cincta]|uniref:Transcription initiation factor TFIID subunit 3 n=1 Tax=Orchesella cincta TaxID=48709 RepID=A0A1D2MLE7_ORCCI|nr:Transcription initiation factor TFIID subunit 3 [Orchesella cincta]
MVYPKGAYFGHAYKAMVPFHLRRQQRLKKPRNVFHALKMLSDGVLWDLVRQKEICLKELYFDTTTMEPDIIFRPSAFSNGFGFTIGKTDSKSPKSCSSTTTGSSGEDADDEKEWNSGGFGFCVQEEPTAPTQEGQTNDKEQEDEISMNDENFGFAEWAKHPKKRASELDTLYLAEQFLPDPEKRKLAWKGPPPPPKVYLTPEQMKRMKGLKAYQRNTNRAAARIRRAMREKAKTMTSTETDQNEPCCSSSIACTKEKPSTSKDAKRESIAGRLTYILHNFFASMPGKEYRRPSLNLKTQFVSNNNDETLWLCPVCKKDETKSIPDDIMISCDKCGDWYHYSCIGIRGEYNERRRWYCKRCLFKAARDNKFDPGEYPLFEHK